MLCYVEALDTVCTRVGHRDGQTVAFTALFAIISHAKTVNKSAIKSSEQ